MSIALNLVAPFSDYVDTLVHPSARQNALTVLRHRSFIAPRLIGTVAAFSVFPVYVAARGVPTGLEIALLSWFCAPVLIASFLSRTGQYERAHVLSSLSLAVLITCVAAKTGGLSSFAAAWLVLVPFEAALSASRRVVTMASAFALGAASFLLAITSLDLVSPPGPAAEHATLAALGLMAAALYGSGLAVGVVCLIRTSATLLGAEEDRYRLLALNMTDTITRHGKNGAVLFASPAVESLLGLRVADVLGHGLFDRIHVGDRPAYLKALADAAAFGEVGSVEFRARKETQGDRPAVVFVWIEMRCRSLEQAVGDRGPSAERDVVAVMRDITPRKDQQMTLGDARAEAERASESKNRFLATMSHELRTPLNAIIGFSEMLTKEDTLPIDAARRRDYARLINESGHHLLSVVNDILDMSKIDSGNFEVTPEPFEPRSVIADCCDLMALKAREADVQMVVRLPENLQILVADKRSLSQIMFNLVSNAIKFTSRGGSVTISAQSDADHFAITVEDSGVGIAADDLPRIGRPFSKQSRPTIVGMTAPVLDFRL